MSIISTAAAVPSRLFAIYMAVIESDREISLEELEHAMTPKSLIKRENRGDKTSLFKDSFREAKKLTLVEENNGMVTVNKNAIGSGEQDLKFIFRKFLENMIFNPKLNQDTQQTSFVKALSWFLSQNPLLPLNFKEGPAKAVIKDLGPGKEKELELGNENRAQNFYYWARYFGFANFMGVEENRVVYPDPTTIIKENLHEIFQEKKELSIESFFKKLSNFYPVFEKGVERETINNLFKEKNEDAISFSSSFALERLERMKIIELKSPSDSEVKILCSGIKSKSRTCSHIALRSD